MRGNFWTKIGAKAGVVAVIFTLWFFRQGRIEQSKKLESKPLIPKPLKPHELPLDQNPLAVAAIHATLLAIFLGVLSTYGFYRRTVVDQLELKLFQEARAINDLYYPGQVTTEAKELIEGTPLTQLVEQLSVIILKGGSLPNSNIYSPDPEIAAQGRKAFHLMYALLLHYPFQDSRESISNPTPVPFRDINAIQSWVTEMGKVTIPLRQTQERFPHGLSRVLTKSWVEDEMLESGFGSSFFKHLEAAHEIRRKVNDQLQEIERNQKSAIGKGWLRGGFLGASSMFVIGVLMPLYGFPHKLIQWRFHLVFPTIFYILVLARIAYLIW